MSVDDSSDTKDVKPKIKKEPESDDDDVDGVDMGNLLNQNPPLTFFNCRRYAKADVNATSIYSWRTEGT